MLTMPTAARKKAANSRTTSPQRKPPLEMLGLPGRLAQARERAQLNQKQLAEASGVPAAVISRLERGLRLGNVSARTLVDLALATDVPVGWLIANEPPRRPSRAPPIVDPELDETERRRILQELAQEAK